ncbi:MAG: TSUP family transporter, partial [Pseudomonadota bacterium]
MTMQEVAILIGVGLFGGAWNSVAGGATLFTFPALMATGLPPVAANATNVLALMPANAFALLPFRAELRAVGTRAMPLLAVSGAGAVTGAHVLQARSNLLWGLSPVRAEPAGLRKIAFDVFANTTLRQLIYLLWALNLLQGIVFGALPVLMETTFQKDPAGAAALFAGIHIGSWVFLWAYPSVARRFSRPTRATWAMALSALGLAAAFLTSNVAVFATAVC